MVSKSDQHTGNSVYAVNHCSSDKVNLTGLFDRLKSYRLNTRYFASSKLSANITVEHNPESVMLQPSSAIMLALAATAGAEQYIESPPLKGTPFLST